MKMSKHSIIDHKHPTLSILMSPAIHIYIKQVHECMCGLWYGHVCHMADDLNQMKTLSIYQAHQTCFPLHFSTQLQITKSMNLTELIQFTMLMGLQETFKYFQLFDRNYAEYAEQNGHVHIFCLKKGRPCLTYGLNSKLLFISNFTFLSSPYISVYLQIDDRQTQMTDKYTLEW